MIERDLPSLITHTQLRVETAVDALATMFLVECGVLPLVATDGPLPPELGCHLGHGNILVFLDRSNRSTSLVVPARFWL